MPRNPGTGQYSKPIPDAVPNTTIASAPYNLNVDDVVVDLNSPRPLVAGGTGATNAYDARANLQAEVAGVQVTNYASHVFETGSFWSQSGATGGPAAVQLAGTCVVLNDDQDYVSLIVRDMGTGTAYTRQKLAGSWSPWINEESKYVNVTGDTMSGALNITSAAASTSSATGALIVLGGAGIAGNVNVGSGAGIGIGAAAGTQPGNGNTAMGVDMSSAGSVFISRTDSVPLFVARHQFAAAVQFSCLNAIAGSITVTNTATAYNTTSDARLKEDLKSFDAGNIIDDTKVYDFKWKATGERAFGIIAQQAAPVYPTPMFHDETIDRWFVDYSKYVPVLLRELQALRARVTQLETKLASQPT